MMKRMVYIITTLIIVLLVGLAGGIMDIVQPKNVQDVAFTLGYPLYFFTLLGIFKILGALALLLPKKLDTLRVLAYAGFAVDFIFASFSNYCVNESIINIIIPLILLVILTVSYFLKTSYSLYQKN